VTVEEGQVPQAVTVGPAQVDPQSVTLTGARSRVSSVREVAARVSIDATGLNVDQEVDLQAIDSNGTPVAGVQIQPSRARVRVDVARNQATVQLPVRVQLTGAAADGYQVSAVTVNPMNVTVSGEAPVVGRLGGVSTLPVDLAGRSVSFSTDIALDLPQDVTVDGSTMVHVTVGLEVAQVSRTIEVGLEVRGGNGSLLYELSRPSVLVTLSGPAPTINAITPADLHAILSVSALDIGSHQVTPSVAAPDGTQVLLIAPTQVQVDVTQAPHVTPEPSPTPSPTAEPSSTASAAP
jgi:YbbR domain-containing protein